MVPVPLFHTKYPASSSAAARLVYISVSLVSKYALQFLRSQEHVYGHHNGADTATGSSYGFSEQHGFFNGSGGRNALVRRGDTLDEGPKWKRIVFPLLIPVLVLLSGVFAGLTLGYMSLDETQLNVLSISGTPKQREYANKIKPIRKNGHLLLVTLLLANMIVNETLPIIADPVLSGGFQSVVVSTVLIVIFSEIIPQSVCTRHGLYLGAKMAGFTRVLIFGLGVIAWPVAKFLEFVLGKHHGIIYRRAELKELIAMHDSHEAHGGDLKTDTVTIIGATLDLQEKVVRQAMTPIDDVFMLSIDSRLDYELMDKICRTGHSRVPVYEEVEVPLAAVPLGSGIHSNSIVNDDGSTGNPGKKNERMVKVKKIIGVLLVKNCVLLDPRDATPLRKIPLNKVPFIPNNEPLLGMLDKFQEGRSHIAIVSRYSVDKAQSVKKAVKRGLTQRLRARVGMGDTDSSSEDSDSDPGHSGLRWAGRKKRNRRQPRKEHHDLEEGTINNTEAEDGATISGDGDTLKGDRTHETFFTNLPTLGNGLDTTAGEIIEIKSRSPRSDEKGEIGGARNRRQASGSDKTTNDAGPSNENGNGKKKPKTSFQLSVLSRQAADAVKAGSLLEQSMPADAVLAKEGADEFLQTIDPAVMPLGIITLEDVLEELIGEEIYDEFDPQGAHGDPYAYDNGPSSITPSSVKRSLEISESGGPSDLYVSAPNTPSTHIVSLPTPGGTGSRAGTPATGRNIPILLPNMPKMKGLGFLMGRSKSAPPVQRNKKPRRGEQRTEHDALHEADDDEDSGKDEKVDDWEDYSPEKASDMTTVGHNNFVPITVTAPTPMISRPKTAPGFQLTQEIRMPIPVRNISGNTIQQLGTTAATTTPSVSTNTTLAPLGGGNAGSRSLSNSRSTSPAPSFEVILVERNRRRQRRDQGGSSFSGQMNTGANTAAGFGGEGTRGKGFKSSPLAPTSVLDSSASGGSGDGESANVLEGAKGNSEKERKRKDKEDQGNE